MPNYKQKVIDLDPELFLSLGNSNGLTDLSGNGYVASGVGSVVIGGSSPGPLVLNDEAATDFDGTDDRITTTYATRRNYVQNPDLIGTLDTAGKWNPSPSAWGSGTFTAVAVDDPDTPGRKMAQLDCVHDATSSDHQTQFDLYPYTGATAMQVSPGEPVSARIEMQHDSGPTYAGGLNNVYHFYIMFFNAAGAFISAAGAPTLTSYVTGQWTTVECLNAIAPANAVTAKFSWRFRTGVANSVNRHFVRRPILVKGATIGGPYFSGNGYINGSGNWVDSTGESGWLGSTNASFSDIGCFANGTSRTFMGWAYRDASSSTDAMMGASSGVGPIIRCASGSNNIDFYPSSLAAAATWTAGWPGNGQWVHWALVFNEATDSATFYINGVALGAHSGVGNAVQFPAGLGNLQIGARTGSGDPFDGKQAWVSVHERALTANEISEMYLASDGYVGPSLSIVEKPPLRETIIITSPAGQKFRWGEDSWMASDTPDGTSHGSAMPGGFTSLTTNLPRLYKAEYPDIQPLSDIKVLDSTGTVVWEGYMERAPRRSGSEIIVSPDAVGYQNMLEDEQNVNWLGIDSDLKNWGPSTTGRKALQNFFNLRVVDMNQGEAIYDGDPDINLEFTSPWAAAPTAEALYTPPVGEKIAGIYYDFVSASSVASNPLATYTLYIVGAEDPVLLTNPISTSDLYTAAAGSAAGSMGFSPTKKIVMVRWTPPAGANTTDGATYTVMFRVLTALGDHGLRVYDSAAGKGLLASDVIPYIVKKYIPQIRVRSFNVQPTDLVIPHSRGDNTTVPELITEHNKYHLRDWAVWENKDFYYALPGEMSVTRTWKALVGPSQLEETGQDVRRIRNGVYVKYTDVGGVTRVVGPPSSKADYTDVALSDLDPENPANQVGRPLYDMVEMRGVSETAPAIIIGRKYLEFMRQADRSGSAIVSGYIQEESGSWFPHTSVRGGDYIRFVDSSDPTPRRISEVTHSRQGRTSQISLDAPKEGTEAILDRLQLSLLGTGMS
jgi:hypothetical protein